VVASIVAYSAIKLQTAPKQEFPLVTTAVSRVMFQKIVLASRSQRRVTSAVRKATSQKTVSRVAVQDPHLAGMSVIVAEKRVISPAHAPNLPVPVAMEAAEVAMEVALEEEEEVLEAPRKLAILAVE